MFQPCTGTVQKKRGIRCAVAVTHVKKCKIKRDIETGREVSTGTMCVTAQTTRGTDRRARRERAKRYMRMRRRVQRE